MTSIEFMREFQSDSLTVKYDEPLSLHSSFHIGGNADVFLTPSSVESLLGVIKALKENGIRFLIMGNATNLLFDDKGFRGAVISLAKLKAVSIDGEVVAAESGTPVTLLAKAAMDASLTGSEFMYGIPGTVGGAILMNAGAYGGDCSQIVSRTDYLDLDSMTVRTVSNEEHLFSYRHSVFQEMKAVILKGYFQLHRGDRKEISFRMNDLMSRRTSKQPLDFPSAGSVFKRPAGTFAGKLIEESGLKGLSVGDAQVSPKHAGFIVNVGHATSSDVKSLISLVQEKVMADHGILLEREIIFVPER